MFSFYAALTVTLVVFAIVVLILSYFTRHDSYHYDMEYLWKHHDHNQDDYKFHD